MLEALLLAALGAAPAIPPAPPARAMVRPMPPPVPAPAAAPVQWEYNLIETVGINAGPTQEFLGMRSDPTARVLNGLGAEGWELVTAIRERDGERVYYIFKRPIPAR